MPRVQRGWVVLWVLALGACAGACCAATITVDGFDSAAIAAAIAKSQPGDTVSLPAGTYRITAAVTLKSGIKLVGAGQDNTILRFAGDKACVLIALTGCEDVTVSDLGLDAAGSPLVKQGISGYNSRRLKLLRLAIRDLVKSDTWGPHGILFSGDNPTHNNGVTDTLIADCDIRNIAPDSAWGAGIRMAWGSSRNQVTGCRVDNTGRGGIFGGDQSTDLVIRNNVVTGSHGDMLGIEVWGGCDRCVIEDNKIDHWLSIGGCDWCAVRRNVISAKDGSFGFIGIEAIGSYLIFTDNLVDDGQLTGLSLSNVNPKQYHYYADNTFRRCTQWGAQLQGEKGGCAYLYFWRCKFVETTSGREKMWYPNDAGNGFRVNGNTKHMDLEECELRDNGRMGMQVTQGDGDFWSFRRCTIARNKAAAVGAPAAKDAVEWVDCKVEGNASNALPPAKAFATAPPTAAFESPAEAKVGEKVRLASKSAAAQGGIVKAMWDFGDGSPVVGDAVSHIYDRVGTYAVTLIVWDTAGRGARAHKTLKVQ